MQASLLKVNDLYSISSTKRRVARGCVDQASRHIPDGLKGPTLQAFYSGCMAGRPTRPSVRSHFFHSPPTAEPSSLTHPHSPHAPPPPLPPTSLVLDICEMGEPSRKEQGQNPTGAAASNDSSSRRSSERTPPLKRRRIALACTVCRLRKSRVCEHLETPLRALNR